MTKEELEAELKEVRDRLVKLSPSSSVFLAGKIIEQAILHQLKELNK